MVASDNGVNSNDYLTFVGNVVYGTAARSADCSSGVLIYQPLKYDSLPGTHMYVAGNFSFANRNANPCGGTTPTDGNGVIFDTFNGSKILGQYPQLRPAVRD